jgi:hypothetical protein
MAKKGFLRGRLVAIAAVALLVAGCDVGDSGLYNETSLADKLEKLEPNTAQDPYTIALSSSVSINMDAADARDAWTAITGTIADNAKFVVLDLRRCAAPETITGSFGGMIHDNEYIKGIILPPGLTGIGRSAFSGCGYLTGVIIPAGVTSIGESAFEWCLALAGMTLPASVSSIGSHAFYNTSPSLTAITFGGGETSFIYDAALESFPASASLYEAYSTGGAGTYIRTWYTWTKQ